MGVPIGPQGLLYGVVIGPQGLLYRVVIGPQGLSYGGADRSSRAIVRGYS